MRITFFKTPRPKEFHYIPRYYDKRKEETEERQRRIERELGISDDGKYVPGITRGSMQRRFTERKRGNRSSIIRLLVIIAILFLLAYVLLSGNYSFNFLGN